MAATGPITPEPRRFSIRLPRPLWIGLSAVVLAAVAIGLHVGIPIHRQQVAIREIERLGGEVARRPRGPEWFRNFVGEERLMIIDEIVVVIFRPDGATYQKRTNVAFLCGSIPTASGQSIDDATLACIVGLPNLKQLSLRWTNVSDSGMEHVCRLHDLEYLDLVGTDVSDASVGGLMQLRHLKRLVVDRRRVSKSGLARIAAVLPKCKTVSAGPSGVLTE
jgi:hypothetical protein